MQYFTPEYYNLSLESQAQVLRSEAERWEIRMQQEKQSQRLHGATVTADSDAIKIDKTYRLMAMMPK